MSPHQPPPQLTFAGVGHDADNVRKARVKLRGWARDVAGLDGAQESAMMRSVRLAPDQPVDRWDFRLMGELPDGRTFTTLCLIA